MRWQGGLSEKVKEQRARENAIQTGGVIEKAGVVSNDATQSVGGEWGLGTQRRGSDMGERDQGRDDADGEQKDGVPGQQ